VAGDERFTPGEIRRALEGMQKDLKEIKTDLKDMGKMCADRKLECNREFHGRLNVVEKTATENRSDLGWLKRAFWACFGSLATIVVGVIVYIATKAG